MRFFLFLMSLFSAVTVDAGNVDYTNAIFNDPYSSPADTLLKLWVDTCTTENLVVTVTIPAGGINGNYYTSGNDFGPQFFTGLADPSSPGGATLTSATIQTDFTTTAAVPDGGAIWKFWNFNDIRPLTPENSALAGFVNNGYFIMVDIPHSLFNDPPLSANVHTNGQIQISSETSVNLAALISVDQDAICRGGNTVGDPVFSGFQGQQFQFHGLPDEHFNLVSSPDVQLNSHFVYLSSGKCDYNDTECYTHPGTYMDVLGFSIAETHVKLVAGTHEAGLRIWVNDIELQRGQQVMPLSTNVSAALKFHKNGRVDIRTELMNFHIANSDMFMNIQAGLNQGELLRVGAVKHTVTDKEICHTNSETHNHQLIESTVAAKYPVNTPLHGLIGQSWRNVKVCGKDWMGTVQDYLVSDLFASDNHYSYFKW